MTGTVQGSVLLRKLKTGQTAYVRIETTRQLFQIYSYDGKNYSFGDTDWAGSSNPPVCTVKADGATVSSVVWYINDTAVNNGALDGVTVTNNALTIKRNVAVDMGYTSGTLKAVVSLIDSSGNQYQVEKTEPIRVQQAVSDGYNVMISAKPASLDDSERSTVLTATLFSGTSQLSIDGTETSGRYVKWFKGNQSDTAVVGGSTLTVEADDVNGAQLYVAKAYVDGVWVDSEGYTVVDYGDQYYIEADVTQYASTSDTSGTTQKNVTSVNVAESNALAVVTYRVMDRVTGSEVSSKNWTLAWKCYKYHAGTMKYIAGSASNATSTSDSDTAVSGSYSTSNSISVYNGDYYSTTDNNGNTVEAYLTEVICDAEVAMTTVSTT